MRKLYLCFKLLLGFVLLAYSKAGYSQCAIFSETFDSSLGQFTASNGSSGNWQFTSSCSYSSSTGHSIPGSALFSGSGCQFGNSFNTVYGDMTSPAVFIPPTGAELTFNYYLYNECGNFGSDCYFDRLSFQISDDNGANYTTIMDSYTDYGNGVLYNGGWSAITYDLSAYAGEEILIRFNFNSIDGAVNAYDGVYVDDVIVTAICPFNNDAGIAGIISPSLPTCDLDSLDIIVKLQSLGLDTLYSCVIKWQIDNGPITTFNYSGVVPALGGMDTVNIGTTSFSNFDELTVWTEMPNGDNDSLPQNDEDSLIVALGLSGTYTVPGDYSALSDAADALNTFGVCDDVVFNIASGTYNEQLTLGNILGVSETATVTFQSANNDSADVWIEYQSNTQSDNWVVRLNSSDWITLRGLTIRNTGLYEFANGVNIENGANHNVIEACHIISNTYGYWQTGNYESGVYMAGTNMQISITDSKIEKGNCGIYASASSAYRSEGLHIEGCSIEDVYYSSCYIQYVDEVNFLHNRITADNGLGYFSTGLEMYYCDAFNIIGNYIGTDYYNGYAYAMELGNCIGSNTPRSQIANNCLRAGSAANGYGGYNTLYMYASGVLDIYHNTIVRNGEPYSWDNALYIDNGGLIRMKNNIIADLSGGYAFQSYGVFSLSESDNNNFYSTNSTPIYWGSNAFSSVEDYQEASGFDLNSVEVDPSFINELNCVTCNDDIDGGGVALASVTDDISGNPRSVSTPDIGAVEFVDGSSFTLGPDTTLCATEYLMEAGPAQLVVWNVDGNIVTGPDYLLTSPGVPQTFNVSVSVTTLYCGSGNDAAIITLIPNAELDSATHICAGESTTLQPGGGANATYLWNNGEVTASLEVNEPGVYTVVKTEDGCESEASTEVTVSTAVDILDFEACEDEVPVTIDGTIPDGTSYTWSGGSSTTTAVNTFDTEGAYSITATDSYGCTSSDEFELFVLGEPVPVIDYVGTGGLALFFNSQNSLEVGPSASYLWTFNGIDTSSAPNPSYVFPWSASPATYPVLLVIDNGCGVGQATIQVTLDPLGTDPVNKGDAFGLFPNPARDVVYIKGTQEWNSIEISILDNSGRLVYTSKHTGGNQLLELNTSGLASGSYIVKINTDGSNEVHPLILK